MNDLSLHEIAQKVAQQTTTGDYAESFYQALVRVRDRKAYSEQLDELLRGIEQGRKNERK